MAKISDLRADGCEFLFSPGQIDLSFSPQGSEILGKLFNVPTPYFAFSLHWS